MKLKLTVFSKILIVVLCLGVAGFGGFKLGLLDSFLGKAESPTVSTTDSNGVQTTTESSGSSTANNNSGTSTTPSNGSNKLTITLDEWIGWKTILDANGGLETKPGSLMAKYGVDLTINVVNDATQSSSALIKGSVQGAGYTVNRYAFLYPKFASANVPVSMAYITNSSAGGDGIIAKSSIKSIEQLVGKKIAVPRYSEAQTLVMWLISNSNLTQEQQDGIVKSMVYFDTPDDAAKAFFAGKVDAAATWEPYITQAQSTTGSWSLFSTKSATNLILDGIIFREDYLKANGETVTNFIRACLEAESMYKTDMTAIKEFPLFSTMSDAEIQGTAETALIANYADNETMLSESAKALYTDMCAIWASIKDEVTGDYLTVMPEAVDLAFTSEYIAPLKPEFVQEAPKVITFTEKDKEVAKAQDNTQALLKQTLTINFEPNLAIISEDSLPSLQAFVKTAMILNGAIIQIEGNTDKDGSATANEALSLQRAKSVATYLQSQGIDATRFILVGNGFNKPLPGVDPNTKEGKAMNRRTDVYFKIVE